MVNKGGYEVPGEKKRSCFRNTYYPRENMSRGLDDKDAPGMGGGEIFQREGSREVGTRRREDVSKVLSLVSNLRGLVFPPDESRKSRMSAYDFRIARCPSADFFQVLDAHTRAERIFATNAVTHVRRVFANANRRERVHARERRSRSIYPIVPRKFVA